MTKNTPIDAIKKPAGGWLASIDSPADLRKLPLEALPEVCAEIREFLIKACADNPGHFASRAVTKRRR